MNKEEDKYDDPIKQLSREEQLKFERYHLTSINPKDRTTVYLPGPKNLEWWIYDQQNILPENSIGLETDEDRYKVLLGHTHGINVKCVSFEEFFAEQVNSSYDTRNSVISLDTEGQLTGSFIKTLISIVQHNLIETPGVLVTNVYGQRESELVKRNYLQIEMLRRFKSSLKNQDIESFVNHIQGQNIRLLKPKFPEINENPISFRSDAISETLKATIYTSDIKTIAMKLEFIRKYHGKHFDQEMLRVARDIESISSESERDVISKLLDGSFSLEEAIANSNDLKFNLEDRLFVLLDKLCSASLSLSSAVYTAFFDTIYISKHRRIQYTSKTKGKMYMDLIAINRPSTSIFAPLIYDFKKRLIFNGKNFLIRGRLEGETRKPSRKHLQTIKKNVKALYKFRMKILDTLFQERFPEDRIELKLQEPVIIIHQAKKSLTEKIPTLKIEPSIKKLGIYDLVPNSFFERLPENYQKRLNCFVEQINQEGIDQEIFKPVREFKWYRRETLPEIDFYAFWDGLYLKTISDRKMSEEDVTKIWGESKDRTYITKRKYDLEERIIQTPALTVSRDETPYIDSKHPDYHKERVDIIKLLDDGLSNQEIRELKPYVKKQAIAGISAWYRHRESWK